MPTPMYPLARISAHRRQRRCTRSSAPPQLSFRVHRTIAQERFYSAHNATGAAPATRGPLRAVALTQRLFYHLSRPPPPPTAAPTRAGSAFFLFRNPSFFFWLAVFAHAVFAHAHARTRPHTCTRKNDRRRTATCGPPAWLTGPLHDGGIRSARSPKRWAPLLATPIATPLQGGRRPGYFERWSGLLFLEVAASCIILVMFLRMLTLVVDNSIGWHLKNKSLSPTRAPDLGDIETYFFLEKNISI